MESIPRDERRIEDVLHSISAAMVPCWYKLHTVLVQAAEGSDGSKCLSSERVEHPAVAS